MATTCFKPVFGKRVRLTRLDACGVPVAVGDTTECIEVVSDGFITLTLSSETEEGTEITQKNASGAVCISQKAPDSFKRFTLEMEFCGVDPYLLSFMTNMDPYLDGTDVIGAVAYEGVVDDKFALELWTGLAGQACEAGAEEASGYLLLPFVNAGVLGDIEVTGEDAVTFSVQGAYTVSGHAWGVGPYDVVLDETDAPAPLPTPLEPDQPLLIIETGMAPPPAACGCSTMGSMG
jgi:hypothetical protein